MLRLLSGMRIPYLMTAVLLGAASCSSNKPIDKIIIPAGASIVVSLQDRLGTEWNHPGDSFEATTLEPIRASGKVALRAGAKVRGSLARVDKADADGRGARMTLNFDVIVDPKGPAYLVEAKPVTLVASGGPIAVDEGEILDEEDPTLAASGKDILLGPGQKLRLELTEPIVLRALAQMPD